MYSQLYHILIGPKKVVVLEVFGLHHLSHIKLTKGKQKSIDSTV